MKNKKSKFSKWYENNKILVFILAVGIAWGAAGFVVSKYYGIPFLVALVKIFALFFD